MVASRRLSAAPLPWPYETHPRETFSLSATPDVGGPATTPPWSLFLSFRQTGMLLGLCSLSPRSCSRLAHFLSLPPPPPPSPSLISSCSFTHITFDHLIVFIPFFRSFSASRLSRVFRFFFPRFWDSTFAQDSSRSVHPLSSRLTAAELSPENHPTDECTSGKLHPSRQ